MDYIARIKKIKNERKITNEKLSDLTGIPLGTLSKILAGISDSPKLSNMVLIADALGCTLDYIVSGTPENTNNYTLSAEEIAWKLMCKREKIRLLALVDTLEYLKKGGRISSAVALAGGLLNIKPVITLTGGEIKVLGKARGSKQGNNLLVQEIEKAGGIDFSRPILLGFTGLSEALLLKYIEDSKYIWEEGLEKVRYTTIGSVIGTHVGPGAIAVAFFKK